MKVQMEFELPFEQCMKCKSFAPVVENYEIGLEERFSVKLQRKLTCKGYTFCSYLKENVLNERS